jgi:hypothetical protein
MKAVSAETHCIKAVSAETRVNKAPYSYIKAVSVRPLTALI